MEGTKALPPSKPYKGLPLLCGVMMLIALRRHQLRREMLKDSMASSVPHEATNRNHYSSMHPMSRKWSANCLELISVRLDHLEKKYSTMLTQYDRNHKNMDKRVEGLKEEVLKMEAYMIQNHKLAEAYNNVIEKLESKMMEIRNDARNWLCGLPSTLDTHVRKQLDNIGFDANIMQEQRGLVKLDDMVERLRGLHGSVVQELGDIIQKRQMTERTIMQMISEETESLKDARNNYMRTKEDARGNMSNALSDLKRDLTEELSAMVHTRGEFEDLVLETLERQMSDFTVTKHDRVETD